MSIKLAIIIVGIAWGIAFILPSILKFLRKKKGSDDEK